METQQSPVMAVVEQRKREASEKKVREKVETIVRVKAKGKSWVSQETGLSYVGSGTTLRVNDASGECFRYSVIDGVACYDPRRLTDDKLERDFQDAHVSELAKEAADRQKAEAELRRNFGITEDDIVNAVTVLVPKSQTPELWRVK